ncbi:MAG: hydroxymethylbilane synthase [Rudaea sp.]
MTSEEQGYKLTTSSIHFARPIVIGTRGSALAQWQAQFVAAALRQLAPGLEIEIRIIKTTGDKDQTRPLADLGGLGVFTKEIESALLAGEIDVAVHSLKDLPTEMTPRLTLAAIPAREDARDCIVSRHGVGLAALPRGARIGTSSARRTAQILALRPDAQVVPLRGNVDTRLKKSQTDEYDAVMLAAAGVTRLGRGAEITEYLPFEQVLPDPGQGALGIEIRSDDAPLAALLAPLNDPAARAAVLSERSFLQALGGGCRMPIGAYAEAKEHSLSLRGVVASLDGRILIRGQIEGDPADAERLGSELAGHLSSRGAAEILEAFGRSGPRPLSGKRIIITRALEQASALADQIRASGGEPVEFPTIEIAPLEDFRDLDAALDSASAYDWIVFTSANGVRAVAERAECRGQALSTFYKAEGRTPEVAAIGPATARALEGLGVKVDFVPSKYLGKQIALELPVEPGQRALLLRADIASDELARGLEARGVQTTNVDAYRTIMPQPPTVDLAGADAITFTSSSTVRNFAAIAGDQSINRLERLAVFAIGPVTARTARELGLRVDAVAAEHTVEGLVKTILDYYAEPGSE